MATNIPVEIWQEVFEHLSPPDVFSFSQICPFIRKTTSQRHVWTPILRSECKKRALFSPSFPIDDMSLDELQRAALAPYRLENKIQATAPDATLKPSSVTYFSNGDAQAIADSQLQCLVPGGRFFITVDPHSLCIFDLGPPGRPLLAPPPLIAQTSLLIEGEDVRFENLEVLSIDEIVLMIGITFWVGDRSGIHIWEVHNVDTVPSFKNFRFLGMNGTKCCSSTFSLHKGLAFISLEATCVLWNFTSDRYSLLDLRNAGSIRKIAYVDETVIAFTQTSVLVWIASFFPDFAIPPSSQISIAHTTLNQIVGQVPDFTLNYPFAIPRSHFGGLQLSLRSSPGNYPFTFDVILPSFDGDIRRERLARCSLYRAKNITGSLDLRLKLITDPPPTFPTIPTPLGYYMPNESICGSTFSFSRRIWIYARKHKYGAGSHLYSVVPREPPTSKDAFRIRATRICNHDLLWLEGCLTTGRLVYLSYEPTCCDLWLHFVDYLS